MAKKKARKVKAERIGKIAKNPPANKPIEYLEFVKFIAVPQVMRELKTQGDFSKKFEVSETTLSEWKARDGFWDDVAKQRRLFFKDKTSNVVASIYRAALESSPADRKLWLQYIEEWSEKQELEHKGEGLASLSEAIKKLAEKK